jgi:AcrR family transcriptional regulator
VPTTVGARRGPYAKTAARRREILEAGVEVFATGGYRSSSVREIAERVGMSQSGLLHHFSSKEELLAEILAVRDEASRSRTAVSGGSATLRGVLDLVAYNTGVPGLVRLHAVLSAEATTPEHPAFRYFRDRYEQTVDMLARAFAETKAEGLAPATLDPVLEARSLAALMDGLQVQWLLDDGVDMVATVRNHLLKVTFLAL